MNPSPFGAQIGVQLVLPMLTRIDGPAMVQPELVRSFTSYRAAVRWAWGNRRRVNMTQRLLAEEIGCYAPHITDYLNPDDSSKRKSLPSDRIAAFETAVGNTAVSQWIAMQCQLPVMFLQEDRRAA
jgi:hypothetical protein